MSTPTILIQSLIRRAGGSKIDVAGKTYHFAPIDASDPNSNHVCDVPADDTEAVHTFRSIPEGFKILTSAPLPAAPKEPIGQTIAADQAAAPDDHVYITSPEGERIDLTAMDRKTLVAFAKENFGIAVHHKTSDADAIEKIINAARHDA